MRFAAVGLEQFLEVVQGAAGEADHLLAVVQHLNMVEAQGADDDDLAVIVVAAGGRSFGQAGIGGLHDDDFVGGHAGLQNAPQLQQAGGKRHRQRLAFAGAEPLAIPLGVAIAGQQLRAADDVFKLVDKCLIA